MDLNQISEIRLNNQQITQKKFKQPGEVVKWMGAMQAQDYGMARWAIGLRLPGAREKDIINAIDEGKIIRTHLLRPTWHFVAAEYLQPLLTISAPRIRSAMNSRSKQLGIDDKIISKVKKIIESQILEKGHVLREELVQAFEKAGIGLGDNRAAHLLMYAEIDGLICSGKTRNGKHTYALLEERMQKIHSHNREEALAILAEIYFRSHGPAETEDFTWWSGLTVKEARLAVHLIKGSLNNLKSNSHEYWCYEQSIPETVKDNSVYLLPAFDELIVGYKDRTSVLPSENIKKTILKNGMFKPVILKNGKAVGIWKRTVVKDKIRFESQLFNGLKRNGEEEILKKINEFGRFSGKNIV